MEGGLRRKDTTKGPPLRILSLDGGGIRGYSMLIILQEMMHRTFVEVEGRAPKRNEIPKPCDQFDLIVGTGTGGLIAIMLGRLRMDVETCKDVYVRMTKRVFETDKTFAGIPLKGTLFKASKLEEAIRECVREHTVSDNEGNDNLDTSIDDATTHTPVQPGSAFPTDGRINRSMSVASRYSQIGMSPVRDFRGYAGWGNPNALLYDTRENRTKTAVTAVYRGTPMKGSSVLLRSYDSRKEPPPEKSCTIWQAGRATSATGLAFKPIQIGQSIFLDEGAGKYNPSPQALDEAAVNEWPGREIGVFVSIGTGKRPSGTNNRQHEWWESFVGGSMGDFADARRKLMAKIEGCEQTHQDMVRTYLSKRHVNPENYYRLNVEVGVGEFGMNEWNRLSEISTNTRMYLAKYDVQTMNQNAAVKLAKIHFAKTRWERAQNGLPDPSASKWNLGHAQSDVPIPPSVPFAVELPAGDVPANMAPKPRPTSGYLNTQANYPGRLSFTDDDKFAIVSSDEYPQPVQQQTDTEPAPRPSSEAFLFNTSQHSQPPSSNTTPRRSAEDRRPSPPPLPPKTPIQGAAAPAPAGPSSLSLQQRIDQHRRSTSGGQSRPLPYPEDDGPPPVVNRGRKPEFGVRQ